MFQEPWQECLAQTKHLDTTDYLAWRLRFGNPQTKSQANHGWDGF